MNIQTTGAASNRVVPLGIVAMALIVVASNILVRYPLNDWLTWGTFTYPVAFLVTDVVNRLLGAAAARRVVYVGFAIGVALSVLAAWDFAAGGFDSFGLRIAAASGTAFLCAQLLDIFVFNSLRGAARWWHAPLASSAVSSTLDTALFYSIAFYATGLPWTTWAIGDLGVKLATALVMLLPFAALTRGRAQVARA